MPAIRVPLTLALGFFLFWLSVLLAGADHPPPAGFIWIMVLDLVAAGLVFWRVPFYLHWQANHRAIRIPLAALDGVAIGTVFALVVVLLWGGGESSVQPAVVNYVIWFLVLAAVGAFNSLSIYAISALLSRKSRINQR